MERDGQIWNSSQTRQDGEIMYARFKGQNLIQLGNIRGV